MDFIFNITFTGLPVQVRDSVLNIQDTVPRTDVNRQYFIQSVEGQVIGHHFTISFKPIF